MASNSNSFKFCETTFANLDKSYAEKTLGKKFEHKPSLMLRVVLGALNGSIEGPRKLVLHKLIIKEWEKNSSLPCPDPQRLINVSRALCKRHPELGFAIPPAKLGRRPAYIKQSASVPLTESEQHTFDSGMTGNMNRLVTSLGSSLHAWKQFQASYQGDKKWIDKAVILTQAAKHTVEDALLIHTYKKTEATTMRRPKRRRRGSARAKA